MAVVSTALATKEKKIECNQNFKILYCRRHHRESERTVKTIPFILPPHKVRHWGIHLRKYVQDLCDEYYNWWKKSEELNDSYSI